MKNVFTKEAKIGLVSIVSLALLYLGINYLKGINLFKPTNHYVVACTNVKGVTVSSPVFGDTIEGRMESDMMQSVQEKILPQVELLLPKIDSILGGLQTLVNHPALAQSLNNIETTTNSLAVSSRQLNQMLSKDVPGIMSDLKVITGNFADVSTDLKKLDLATTVNAVNATLDNVEQMTRKLNSKDNSMGLLLNDRALYDNLNSTADNASKLLLDLRQNPKRYVHFSVF